MKRRFNSNRKIRLLKPARCAPRLIVLLAACCLALTACLRPISVDSCGYVVAIGVDEGTQKPYEITLELQRESSGDSSEGSGGSIILSCEARDIFEAVSELAAGTAYDLNFTRTHLFIFGKALAEKGLIAEVLNMSFDVLRIRQSALMLIACCPVRDYIGGLAANNTANIAKMQDSLISNVERTGETAALNVSLFFEAVDGGRFDAVMPLGFYDERIITDTKQRDSATKGENPIADAEKGARIGGMQGLTKGCALFDGAKLCGELSGEETKLLNLVRGDYRRGTLAYPLENGETASLLVVLNKKRTEVETSGENPRARVVLSLNITVEHDPSRGIGESWHSGGRQRLEEYLEGELLKVFEKCRGLDSDAMGFGRYASMNFRSAEVWEAYRWKRAYSALEAEFEITLNLDDEYLARLRE